MDFSQDYPEVRAMTLVVIAHSAMDEDYRDEVSDIAVEEMEAAATRIRERCGSLIAKIEIRGDAMTVPY